jgi:hypothetical protein
MSFGLVVFERDRWRRTSYGETLNGTQDDTMARMENLNSHCLGEMAKYPPAQIPEIERNHVTTHLHKRDHTTTRKTLVYFFA